MVLCVNASRTLRRRVATQPVSLDASRITPPVRRDLQTEGVVLKEIGITAAAQLTVVTTRAASSAQPGIERLRERSRSSPRPHHLSTSRRP